MSRFAENWRRLKEHSDDDARQEIIQGYAYLAKYVVDRLNLRPTAVVSYDDLLSHAIVGLIDAVGRFDPERDVKFETYAVVRIRGAVLDAVKSLDWMPRSMRKAQQDLKRAFAELEVRLGRPATDEEVAGEMGIDADELHEMLGDIGQSSIVSLEEMVSGAEDGAVGFEPQSKESAEVTPMLSLERGEKKRLLAQAIDALPEREKLVISLYYKEGLTLKEIAATLGFTESRACQLHAKAVVRLHGKLAGHAELLLSAA